MDGVFNANAYCGGTGKQNPSLLLLGAILPGDNINRPSPTGLLVTFGIARRLALVHHHIHLLFFFISLYIIRCKLAMLVPLVFNDLIVRKKKNYSILEQQVLSVLSVPHAPHNK